MARQADTQTPPPPKEQHPNHNLWLSLGTQGPQDTAAPGPVFSGPTRRPPETPPLRKRSIEVTLGQGELLTSDQKWRRPRPPPPSPQRHGPHSRLQHREEGIWLRSLQQLAALLPAQPDDVTERLRSIGLPLQDGHAEPALRASLCPQGADLAAPQERPLGLGRRVCPTDPAPVLCFRSVSSY